MDRDPRVDLVLDRLDSIERRLAALVDQAGVARLEPWLSKRQLAAHLGVSPRWLDDRVAEGIPRRLLAGAHKFRVSEVEPWLKRQGERRPGAGYLEEGDR